LQWTTACTLEVFCGCVQHNLRIWFVNIALKAKAAFKEYVCKSVGKTVAGRRPCYGLRFQDLFVNSLLHMILSCKCNLICTCLAFQIRNFSTCIQWLLSLVWTHSWGPISKEKEVNTEKKLTRLGYWIMRLFSKTFFINGINVSMFSPGM
jgi:hypothetical protein